MDPSKLLARAPWISTPSNVPADDEADSGADGPRGNSQLTSATGIVLIALLLVEGVTILSVRQMITLHIFVGVLLLGPVFLKTGSTAYRIVRYYRGAPAYQQKGPPHPVLRVLGPFVILSSLALLGTGIALIFTGDHKSNWLKTAHQTSFWIWVALIAGHLLGHLWEALAVSLTEIRQALRGPQAGRSRLRLIVIALALMLGVGTAMVLLPQASSWTNHTAADDHRPPPGAGP